MLIALAMSIVTPGNYQKKNITTLLSPPVRDLIIKTVTLRDC